MSNLPSVSKIFNDDSLTSACIQSCSDFSSMDNMGSKLSYNSGDFVAALRGLPGMTAVHNRIGVGSFGHVYQCSVKDRSVEDVAVKVLLEAPDPEQNREANLLLKMSHPNLVQLLNVIEEGNIYALVLELCTGGNLMTFLHGSNTIPWKFNLFRRLKAMIGIVSAVQYLHSQNIVHRDVKSSNCLLSRALEVGSKELPLIKLGDLGLARQITESPMTRGAGTVRYMAPEVILSQNYGLAADVFSLGVLLHEIISGEVPFQDLTCNDASIATCIVQGQRPTFENLPPSANRVNLPIIIETCWAMDKRSRLRSIELHAFLANAVLWIPEEEATYM
jgi:serine/threonine protein kinase